MTPWKPLGLLLACVLASAATAAEPEPLTLERALAIAAERSPALASAHYEHAATEASERGAGAPPNPVITAGLGGRTASAEPEVTVGLSQSLSLAETGPARRVAQAASVAAEAWTTDALRRAAADVSAAFLRVVHADARVRIADDSAQLAGEVLGALRARAEAGDAARLEVVIAELALARAQARVAGERAARERVAGLLALALDLGPPTVVVRGPLLDRARYAAQVPPDVWARSDLGALAEEVDLAEARTRLAQSRSLPGFGLWGRYGREEGESVAMGGVSFALPFFRSAQAERGESAVRARQAAESLDVARRAAQVEVETAARVYTLRLQAADVLATDALPRALTQSDAAVTAFGLGALPLPDLLLIRGQAAQAQIEHIDAELAAALAGVELLSAVGWTP